jgi:hypothetical protein
MIGSMRTFLVGIVLAAGCATGGGGGQPAAHFAGEPFARSARPNRITGQVCGMDLDVDVSRRGDGVTLNGFLDGRFPVNLQARAEGNGTVITGALGTRAGESAVELRVAADQLDGRVGFRKFDLHANGDTLAGTMQIPNAIQPPVAVLEGRGQLASLPLDAKAALVPALLTCNVQPQGRWGKSELFVRVGGPAGALPRQSSSLYTRD